MCVCVRVSVRVLVLYRIRIPCKATKNMIWTLGNPFDISLVYYPSRIVICIASYGRAVFFIVYLRESSGLIVVCD